MDPATLVLIPLVAVAAPLLVRGLSRWVRVPVVVFELALGIVVGPSVLGWARPDDFADRVHDLGLAMLFFVAGTEIRLSAVRGRTGATAGLGWIVSLGLGIAVGWAVAPGEAAVIIGIALASTALGALLPILRDAGELASPLGRSVSALGAVGEFGPLLAISLFLGGRAPGIAALVLLLYAAAAAGAILYAYRAPRGALHAFVNATEHTSGQFAVRVVLLILAALVALSMVLRIDILLGAFTAGVVWRILMRDAEESDRSAVESKIEGLAFGFLIPVFFIYTGITFDAAALVEDPVLLGLLGLSLVGLLVVRGIPSSFAAQRGASARERVAVGLFGATGLPIIVAATSIGVEAHLLSTGGAAALVGAGMLSMLLFPILAIAVRGDPEATPAVVDADAE